jgi:short-subunit dehydrogenase
MRYAMDLTGKNIILTGANSGIGFEMLLLLSRENKVLAADLRTDAVEALSNGNVIPFICDISSKEGVDSLFNRAQESLGDVDVFIANAGFAYYEIMDYEDWDRVSRIFDTNAVSPIYSYQRFVRRLDGREGVFAITCSGMGIMGMPGYALYGSTKFALNGFQESLHLERPGNVQITSLYPVAVNTGFFRSASDTEFERPYPMQEPDLVARKMIEGIEKKRRKVFPSRLFRFALVLFTVLPPVKKAYLRSERRKLDRFLEKTGRRI